MMTKIFGPFYFSRTMTWLTALALWSLTYISAEAGIAARTRTWQPGTKLRICFLDGNLSQRGAVISAFEMWIEGTSLSLDPHSKERRDCERRDTAQVRVSFSGSGMWAYIGRDASYIPPSQATLNLSMVTGSDTEKDVRLALHDVGHVLGLEHEHQHPQSYCTINREAAARSFGWTTEEVARNFEKLSPSPSQLITPFDPKSVMMYSFQVSWLASGVPKVCSSQDTPRPLSAGDRDIVRLLYPLGDPTIAKIETVDLPTQPVLLNKLLDAPSAIGRDHLTVPGAYRGSSLLKAPNSWLWEREVSTVIKTIERKARADKNLAPVWEQLAGGDAALAVSTLKDLANDARLPLAQALLGTWFLNGSYLTAHPLEAARYTRAAADRGEVSAHVLFSLLIIGRHVTSPDPKAVVSRLELAARSQDPQAAYLLGIAHVTGLGAPIDFGRSEELLRVAAEAGFAAATTEVGLSLFSKATTGTQQKEALKTLERASSSGDSWATFLLGVFRASDKNDPTNVQAFELIRRAADAGIEPASASLAFALEDGWEHTGESNWTGLLQRAAAAGYVPSQVRLARALRDGETVQRDEAAAVRWYELAASSGSVEAQLELAALLAKEEAGDSKVTAAAWLLVASVQGSPAIRNKAFRALDEMRKNFSTKEWALALSRGGRQIGGGIEASKDVGPPPGADGLGPKLKSHGTGTGTLISQNGYLVTNKHVIDGCDAIRARLEGEWAEVLLPSRDSVFDEYDLAILKLKDRKATTALKLQSGSLQKGQQVYVAGFPTPGLLDQKTASIMSGEISNLNGLSRNFGTTDAPKRDLSTFQFTADIQPGNSGGPVIDKSGALVGIVTRRTELSYASNDEGPKEQSSLLNKALVRQAVKSRFINDILADLADDIGVRLQDGGSEVLSDEKRKTALLQNTILLNCLQRETVAQGGSSNTP